MSVSTAALVAAAPSVPIPLAAYLYHATMNHAINVHLYERLKRSSASTTVAGSLPVLFFGDLFAARVATVGLNPSWQEYLSKGRTELDGEHRRFETLGSLRASVRSELSDAQCEHAIRTMRAYFGPSKPVYSWFAGLSRVVEGFGASFRDGTAAHLDLVQEATDPAWSKLPNADRAAMLDADLPFLRWQIEAFALSAVICTSRTVLDNVVKITNAYKLDSGVFAGRDWTIDRAAVGQRTVAIVGWNIPLARQPGLTRQQQTDLGALLQAKARAVGLTT